VKFATASSPKWSRNSPPIRTFSWSWPPEGTRSLTTGWKSGFYRIALAAKVPVALAFVDYARREAGILTYLTMTGDPAADIAAIAAHYEGREGKHPSLASPIRWLD
jgi:hypothetical protein